MSEVVTTKPVVPLSPPLPVSEFGNSALRASVEKALMIADERGHGNAFLDVNNKGAGVMFAHRFDSGWKIVAAGRYSFKDKAIAASLGASW